MIVKTPDLLKKEIKRQFKDDIVSEDFEIGYIHSNSVVTIRKTEDLNEIWNEIKNNMFYGVMGWCKRRRSSVQAFDDSDDDELLKSTQRRKKVDDKEEWVTRVLSQFFEKHGENFTQFQLRIWSEIFVSGIYGSLYTPPPPPIHQCLLELVEVTGVKK